jgi:hypothetical protein
MQNVNREKFQEWERSPVTLAVKAAILERIEAAKEELVSNAFGSTDFDQFTRGMIKAFREVLDVQLDDVKIQEENEDEV